MRSLCVLLAVFAIGASAFGAPADGREDEIEAFLAEAELPGWPNLLATEEAESRFHGLIELYVWAPLYASGSTAIAGDGGTSTTGQSGLAQTEDGRHLIDVDDVSGWLAPFKSLWRYDRWGIRFDFTYADLNPKGHFAGPGGTPVEFDLQVWFVDLAASFLALEPEIGEQPWFIYVYLGVRYFEADKSLSLGSEPDANRSKSWLGPLVGADFGVHFSESWSLVLRLDAIGFGTSNGAEFGWDTQLGAVWKFGKHHHGLINFGWRLMSIDYRSDHLDLDLFLHGPYLGIGYTF